MGADRLGVAGIAGSIPLGRQEANRPDPELQKMAPEEDPRRELVDRLLEHERFKNAAQMLQQKRLIEENVWSNPQIQQYLAEEEDPGLAVTLFDLVKALAN